MNDYGNDNYARGSGMRESAVDCQLLCQTTEGCMVFTYIPSKKECWLKSSPSGRTFRADSVSGNKYCTGEGVY